MPNYDANFASSPAPVSRVTIRNPMVGKSVTGVPLLIDTGADATLIPRAILPFLDISEDALEPTEYTLVGFDGTRSPAVLVPVELEFLSKRLAGEYLLTEANYGVGPGCVESIPPRFRRSTSGLGRSAVIPCLPLVPNTLLYKKQRSRRFVGRLLRCCKGGEAVL